MGSTYAQPICYDRHVVKLITWDECIPGPGVLQPNYHNVRKELQNSQEIFHPGTIQSWVSFNMIAALCALCLHSRTQHL